MTPTPLPALDSALDRLARRHPRLIDLGLERIDRLLAALGRPERRLPPVVHVAGTNGKGSVIAFLGAIFQAAGFSAHAYTSPHLVRVNERIALAGRPISDGALDALLAECEAVNDGAPITLFEMLTAAAFLEMSRRPADVALIETGLGGRFDATNAIARPALTVITPISRDHVQFLGESIARIAGEKAGILKSGVTAVIGEQRPAASDVLEARARALGAPLRRCGREWRVRGRCYLDAEGRFEIPEPGLFGPHQRANAALAVAALRALPGFRIGEDALAAGIAAARWPARLQRLEGGRLAEAAGAGRELWLDGGHNAAAGEALAEVARGWDDRPLDLIFGHLANREPKEFLAPLAPHVRALRAVAIPGHDDCHGPATLAEAAAGLGIRAAPARRVAAAAASLGAAGGPPSRILICGSLYLAGSVLAGAC